MTAPFTPAHDGLGGPQHFPVIVPALVFPDCAFESCDHDGDCPTHEAVACNRCTDGEPAIGEVTTSRAWPCPHDSEEARE